MHGLIRSPYILLKPVLCFWFQLALFFFLVCVSRCGWWWCACVRACMCVRLREKGGEGGGGGGGRHTERQAASVRYLVRARMRARVRMCVHAIDLQDQSNFFLNDQFTHDRPFCPHVLHPLCQVSLWGCCGKLLLHHKNQPASSLETFVRELPEMIALASERHVPTEALWDRPWRRQWRQWWRQRNRTGVGMTAYSRHKGGNV